MGRIEKLLEKARQSPANFSYKDLVQLAVMVGFEKKGGKGGHELFKHPLGPPRMNFQNVHGKAKDYQVKQLIRYIDDHNLIADE
jgi:predicted RNA binding protein YcfA (HicA-like mRNA interferase family)